MEIENNTDALKKKKTKREGQTWCFLATVLSKETGDENIGKIMDSKNRTLANITDICFPDGKTRLTKRNHYKHQIFPEQNENMFRLKGLAAFQAKSERNLFLITSWQNFKLPRRENEKSCSLSFSQTVISYLSENKRTF